MLTMKQVDAIRPKDKSYRLLDSNGLYLWQMSGKKAWQSGYKIDGKEKVFSQCREDRLQSNPYKVALPWQAIQLSAQRNTIAFPVNASISGAPEIS
jgi:hypothetical protein